MNRKLSAAALAFGLLSVLSVGSANAQVSPPAPIVTDHVQDGVRELQIIFPGQGKTLEFFKSGASQGFKKQSFDKDNVMTEEKTFDEQGGLMNDFRVDAEKVKHWSVFNPKTGKLLNDKQEFPDGKVKHVNYREDGSTVWYVKELPAGDGAPEFRYYTADGRKLVRHIKDAEMTTEVFDKSGDFLYGQRWVADGGNFHLKEVRIGSGHTRRRVVLKDDGTVDHVDYQVCGFVKWSTIKTEPADKLSEPVDAAMLAELNRTDDPTVPQPVVKTDKN